MLLLICLFLVKFRLMIFFELFLVKIVLFFKFIVNLFLVNIEVVGCVFVILFFLNCICFKVVISFFNNSWNFE